MVKWCKTVSKMGVNGEKRKGKKGAKVENGATKGEEGGQKVGGGRAKGGRGQ